MSESIDINGSVSEALERLQSQPGRDPVTGQFTVGNTAAGKTLARSEAFWHAVDDTKGELVARTKTALAVDDSTPETLLGLIDGYAEARLLRMALFQQLVSVGGPVTVKGKSRPLYTAWGQAFDRELKAAVTLGLERKQRPTKDLATLLAEHEEHAHG